MDGRLADLLDQHGRQAARPLPWATSFGGSIAGRESRPGGPHRPVRIGPACGTFRLPVREFASERAWRRGGSRMPPSLGSPLSVGLSRGARVPPSDCGRPSSKGAILSYSPARTLASEMIGHALDKTLERLGSGSCFRGPVSMPHRHFPSKLTIDAKASSRRTLAAGRQSEMLQNSIAGLHAFERPQQIERRLRRQRPLVRVDRLRAPDGSTCALVDFFKRARLSAWSRAVVHRSGRAGQATPAARADRLFV